MRYKNEIRLSHKSIDGLGSHGREGSDSCNHESHHNHDHSSHSHDDHHHAPTSLAHYSRRFVVGIALNLGFVIIEFLAGLWANSLALIADAGHNLTDVAALMIAWGGLFLATKKPSAQFTYGLKKSSVLGALFNSLLLFAALGVIASEAIQKFFQPQEVNSSLIIGVASVGIVINACTALLFLRDRHHDVNIRGAYLHMLADALISVGVVLTGVLMQWTSWQWPDSIVSLIIVGIIGWGTWGLLRQSLRLSLDAVPDHIDINAVKQKILSLSPIAEVHDLHIWPMSTTDTALSAHIVLERGITSHEQNSLLTTVSETLKSEFNIGHPTIQIEIEEQGHTCPLRPDDVV